MRNYAGDYATAANHAAHAMRLSPFDTQTFFFDFALGVSHLLRRNPQDAVPWLRKAARENPENATMFFFLASALAHSGNLDEARSAAARTIELRLNPNRPLDVLEPLLAGILERDLDLARGSAART